MVLDSCGGGGAVKRTGFRVLRLSACAGSNPVPRIRTDKIIRNSDRGLWSSGYDIALTRRRSPVQVRPGPLYLLCISLMLHICMPLHEVIGCLARSVKKFLNYTLKDNQSTYFKQCWLVCLHIPVTQLS